jgi:hypothetical protein
MLKGRSVGDDPSVTHIKKLNPITTKRQFVFPGIKHPITLPSVLPAAMQTTYTAIRIMPLPPFDGSGQ